jgi:hypothetical protein
LDRSRLQSRSRYRTLCRAHAPNLGDGSSWVKYSRNSEAIFFPTDRGFNQVPCVAGLCLCGYSGLMFSVAAALCAANQLA